MKNFLKRELLKMIESPEYYDFDYSEDINKDVLTDKWLDNRTSYIYKVAVMVAIDKNKCDFAHVVIGTKRKSDSEEELKGYLHFKRGENDDMGRVIQRAFDLIKYVHPAFDPN